MRAHTYVKVTTQYGHDVVEARHEDGALCTVWLPVERDAMPYDDAAPLFGVTTMLVLDDVPIEGIEIEHMN